MSEFIDKEGTIAYRVTQKLREDIISKKIEAGSRITIKEISERYGVSPMPVREAFRTLEGESLLEINAYKGATILRIDRNFVDDIYGLLRAFECLVYESALPKITEDTIKTLRDINKRIADIASTETKLQPYPYVDMNTEFHNTIMELGTNKKALEYYYYYHNFIRTLRISYLPSIERVKQVAIEHEKLIEALEKKDVIEIKKAVDEHGNNAKINFMNEYEAAL